MTKDLKPLVSSFVKDLNGRYRKHISDEMLVEVLDLLITNYHNGLKRKEETVANSVYLATFPLFERILEYNLQMGGNGHHVAQELAEILSRVEDH